MADSAAVVDPRPVSATLVGTVAAAITVLGLALEGRRRVDSGRHRAGTGIDVQSGMHRDGLDPPVAHPRVTHPAVKPPSTTSSAPVMNDDSSLARNSAT